MKIKLILLGLLYILSTVSAIAVPTWRLVPNNIKMKSIAFAIDGKWYAITTNGTLVSKLAGGKAWINEFGDNRQVKYVAAYKTGMVLALDASKNLIYYNVGGPWEMTDGPGEQMQLLGPYGFTRTLDGTVYPNFRPPFKNKFQHIATATDNQALLLADFNHYLYTYAPGLHTEPVMIPGFGRGKMVVGKDSLEKTGSLFALGPQGNFDVSYFNFDTVTQEKSWVRIASTQKFIFIALNQNILYGISTSNDLYVLDFSI